jgi:hypothetical protein
MRKGDISYTKKMPGRIADASYWIEDRKNKRMFMIYEISICYMEEKNMYAYMFVYEYLLFREVEKV